MRLMFIPAITQAHLSAYFNVVYPLDIG